ncbi:MAG: tail fiber domain-containing protein [Saprospiraceae bacterium]|nr:tail fiber domain-containing protein [Saprospiraceae bacterium]
MKPSCHALVLIFLLLLPIRVIYGQAVNAEGPVMLGTPGDGNHLLTFNTERPWIFRQLGTGSGTALELFSTIGLKDFVINTTGNIGIGTTTPFYKLDIADRIRIQSGPTGSAGLWLNNPSNSAAIAFMGTKELDLFGLYGNNAGWRLLMNTNTGAVAIGTQNPVAGYQLSVQGNQYLNGLLLTTGDIEIGGGGQFAGNVNVSGWIGVGGAPTKPLEIHSFIPGNFPGTWTKYDNGGFTGNALCIQAHGQIIAEAYWATSDLRIKNVLGTSNSAADLKMINSMQVTDYTMKDKYKYGSQTFKKIIAQQIEQVCPQVVNRGYGFIPNVYAAPINIERIHNGSLLTFQDIHHLTHEANKIQIISDQATNLYEIIAIPSEYQVLIKATDLKAEKVFVYGEEVADFRSVDYEGLTTLNISAIQELSKIVSQQHAAIQSLSLKISQLEKAIGDQYKRDTMANKHSRVRQGKRVTGKG